MPSTPSHEPRLNQTLRALLTQQRVAALGTLDAQGGPFVSMVPYAIDPASGALILHVSGLAAHSQNLVRASVVSVLVTQTPQADQPVHALPRVTLMGVARVLASDSPEGAQARAAYLARFPEAQPMTALGDFRFVSIQVHSARQIAGFGAARSLDASEIAALLQAPV